MLDGAHGFVEQHRYLFVWARTQDPVVLTSSGADLWIKHRNLFGDTSSPNRHQSAAKLICQFSIGHCSQEFVFGN
jgi:hypothetical protein